MNYELHLTTLQHLLGELNLKLTNEQSSTNEPEKVETYRQQIRQIESEIQRINQMRSYKNRTATR